LIPMYFRQKDNIIIDFVHDRDKGWSNSPALLISPLSKLVDLNSLPVVD